MFSDNLDVKYQKNRDMKEKYKSDIPKNARAILKIPNYFSKNVEKILRSLLPIKPDLNLKEKFSRNPNFGPYIFENGAVYTGQWKNGLKDGFGKINWSDGSIFEGYWLKNKISGFGRLIDSDGNYYIGSWKDNKASGKGEYYQANGTNYKGVRKKIRKIF